MIRAYLDLNIISRLRTQSHDNTVYKRIADKIVNNRDKILIPYTLAHLGDLVSNYDSERSKQETENDLEFINYITQQCTIIYHPSSKRNSPAIQDTKIVFENVLDFYKNLPKNFEDLFSDLEDNELQSDFDKIINQLKSLPSANPVKSYNIIRELENGKTLLDDINNLIGIPYNYLNTQYYKSVRENTLNELRLNHNYKDSTTPIKEISNNLKKSTVNKTLVEFLAEIPSVIHPFISHYISLDYLGLYKDKKFKNLLLDSIHAFYGAFCDYFVTDDDNTYQKSYTNILIYIRKFVKVASLIMNFMEK